MVIVSGTQTLPPYWRALRVGKEVNVWSSTVYSCDFHEGRQHSSTLDKTILTETSGDALITLLMFVLNFVLFFSRQYFITLLMLVLNLLSKERIS